MSTENVYPASTVNPFTIPLEYYPLVPYSTDANVSYFSVENLVNWDGKTDSYLFSSGSPVRLIIGETAIFPTRKKAFQFLYLNWIWHLVDAGIPFVSLTDEFLDISRKIAVSLRQGQDTYSFLSENIKGGSLWDVEEEFNENELENNDISRLLYEDDIVTMAKEMGYSALMFQKEDIGSVIISIGNSNLDYYSNGNYPYTGNVWYVSSSIKGTEELPPGIKLGPQPFITINHQKKINTGSKGFAVFPMEEFSNNQTQIDDLLESFFP